MNRTLKLAVSALILPFLTILNSNAQLVVDGTLTPQQLVEDILVGEGVTVSNVTLTGADSQRGYFDGTNSNIGLDGGVILSSGDINIAVGPNTAGGEGMGLGGDGDPDLAELSGVVSHDAVILEFDFIPIGERLEFDYVFGSEEYNEYTCAGVNDVFGFFLSGPGINGPFTNNAINIALIPGTETQVSINTVNNGMVGTNGTLANCENLDPDWEDYNVFFVDNPGGPSVEYDGFTVPLTAKANVFCDSTYHIKLALSDGGDGVFDSGVFLKEGSFVAEDLRFQVSTPSADSTVVEGCTEGIVTLITDPRDTTLAFDILLSGTAVDGVDYTGIPDSLILPAGDSIFSFTVTPLEDGEAEVGLDTIIITIETINSCGYPVTNVGYVFIQEDYDIDLELVSEDGPCAQSEYSVVSANINGGNPDFTYQWSTGDTTETILVGEPTETTVTLTVIDMCGEISNEASVTVPPGEVPPLPEVSVSQDVTLNCPDDEAQLTAVGTGFGTLDYEWDNGAGNTSTVSVQPTETTTYTVTVTDDCEAFTTGQVVVTVNPYDALQVSGDQQEVVCPGDELVLIALLDGGLAPVDYVWSNGATEAATTVAPTTTSEYTVTVTDDCDLEANASFNITVPVYDLQISTIPDSTICELGEIELFVTATGGALNSYTYDWTGQDIINATDNDTVFVSSTESIETPDDNLDLIYQVEVTDHCGNVKSQSIEVTIRDCELVISNVFTPGVDGFNDFFEVTSLDFYPNSTLRIFNRWGFCVFESENYQNDWNGGNLEAGVYYYMFFPSDPDIEPMTGYVHLIRENN